MAQLACWLLDPNQPKLIKAAGAVFATGEAPAGTRRNGGARSTIGRGNGQRL